MSRTEMPDRMPDKNRPDIIPGIVRPGRMVIPLLRGNSIRLRMPEMICSKAADCLGFLRLVSSRKEAGQKCRTEVFMSGLNYCPAP
jgi:hypothetical protein